jgi:Cu+-exporting ATPase
MEEPFGLEEHGDEQPVRSIDPVCGKAVDEDRAAGKRSFWGQTYYFCSAGCRAAFEQTPELYAGQQR